MIAKKTASRWLLPVLVLAAGLAPGWAYALPGTQNAFAQVCQGVGGADYTANELLTLALAPPADLPSSIGSYAANWQLKLCPPQIVAPSDLTGAHGLDPVAASATSSDPELPDPAQDDPTCYAEFRQKTRGNYDNLLGIPLQSLDDWGTLGTPQVFHFNTAVYVRMLGPPVADDPSTPYDESLNDYMPTTSDGMLKLPVGKNSLVYRADTLVAPLDFAFIYIPEIPAGTKLYKSMIESSSKFRQLAFKGYQKFAHAFEFVNNPVGHYGVDQVIGVNFRHSQLGVIGDVYNQDFQQVWVYDRIPPVLTASTDVSALPANVRSVLSYDPQRKVYYMEAIQPGGISESRAVDFLSRLIKTHDHCNRPVQLTSNGGGSDFWATGQHISLVWTATDPGPRDASGAGNSVQLVQKVEVRDTYPPVLLAPPSLVREVPAGDANATVKVNLGAPRVFDLADLTPQVSNDATGDTFGLGLSQVTWTASDGANTSKAVQLINVKVQGTNTPPVADAQTVDTRSFQDTGIVLSGSDADYHPSVSRYDPLTFSIVSKPQHGTFVAPLLPFFIDDYRLEASALKFSGQPWQQDGKQYCIDRNHGLYPNGPGNWQMGYPYAPSWMSVDDAGNTIVYDQGDWQCQPGGDSSFQHRFAIFDANHELTVHSGTISAAGNPSDIYWEPGDHHIYVTQVDSQGDDYIYVYDASLTQLSRYNLGTGNANAWNLDSPVSIAVDRRGIMYAANSRKVNAYRQVAGASDVAGGDAYLGRAWTSPYTGEIKSIATDSQNNLYISYYDRIVKVRAATLDGAGNFTSGTKVGWLGYCSSNVTSQYACDTPHRRSVGFACTDQLCGRDTSYGDQPGQFNGAEGIAVDPHDVLYVADHGNARVQRFTADGFFGGQAKSKGVGYGFLLGDFGNPDDIEVNSDHFYILNRDANLLHIFTTTPVQPIDDSHAKVTYRSDNNFTGTDRFRFGVTDGFDSAQADVTVNVTRNFRPPEVPDSGLNFQAGDLPEDQSLTFTVPGTDPDADPLTVVLVTAPAHGKLTFSGLDAVYTPAANYNGPDAFTYRLNDGTQASANTGHVSLTVDPVEDPPTIDVAAGATVNQGFRLAHRVDVFDPDANETLLVSINWGDGSDTAEGHFELNGQPVSAADARNPDGTFRNDVTTTGPILNVDANGRGTLLADHIYTQAGTYNAVSCVSDRAQLDVETQIKQLTGASRTTCATTQVTVGSGAALLIDIKGTPAKQSPGGDVQFDMTVHNLAFELDQSDPRYGQLPAAGASALGVVIEGGVARGLALTGVTGPDAACSLSGATFSCNVPQLDYGKDTALTVAARVAPKAPGRGRLSLVAEASWTDMREVARGAGAIEVIAGAAAPSLDRLSADSGPTTGYTKVTLTGSDFQSGIRVLFGDVQGSMVDLQDSTVLTVVTPPEAAGRVDVTAINPDGQRVSRPGAWTYVAPAATAVGGGGGGGGSGGGGAVAPPALLAMALGWRLIRRRGVL